MVFAKHFIYRNMDSRDYGLILCSFDGTSLGKVNALTMEGLTAEIPLRLKQTVHGVKYSNVLSFTIQVIRNDFQCYTREQTRELIKWLGKRKYDWITFYDDNYVEMSFYCYPKTISQKKANGRIFGYEIEFETNSPFAWTSLNEESFIINISSQEEHIYVDTDEDDYIYPYISLKKNGKGDITIRNCSDIDEVAITDYYETTIKNCIDEEEIILDCDNKIITSNDTVNHQFFLDDYNFKFPRLLGGDNHLIITGNCEITMKYRCPIKIGEF